MPDAILPTDLMVPDWGVDDEVAALKIACTRLDLVLEKNVERLKALHILGDRIRLHTNRVRALARSE